MMASGFPVVTTANRRAETNPAPAPMPSREPIVELSRLIRGVRRLMPPTNPARMHRATKPFALPRAGLTNRTLSGQCDDRDESRPLVRWLGVLRDDVRQQAEEAGALDRLGEFAL